MSVQIPVFEGTHVQLNPPNSTAQITAQTGLSEGIKSIGGAISDVELKFKHQGEQLEDWQSVDRLGQARQEVARRQVDEQKNFDPSATNSIGAYSNKMLGHAEEVYGDWFSNLPSRLQERYRERVPVMINGVHDEAARTEYQTRNNLYSGRGGKFDELTSSAVRMIVGDPRNGVPPNPDINDDMLASVREQIDSTKSFTTLQQRNAANLAATRLMAQATVDGYRALGKPEKALEAIDKYAKEINMLSPFLRDSDAAAPGDLPTPGTGKRSSLDEDGKMTVTSATPLGRAADAMLRMEGKSALNPQDAALIQSKFNEQGVKLSVNQAYCAAAVEYALATQGIKGPQVQFPYLAASYRNWGEKVSAKEVERGDVIVLGTKHVGMATGKVNEETGQIEMISGNSARRGFNRDWVTPTNDVVIRRATDAQKTSEADPSTLPTPAERLTAFAKGEGVDAAGEVDASTSASADDSGARADTDLSILRDVQNQKRGEVYKGPSDDQFDSILNEDFTNDELSAIIKGVKPSKDQKTLYDQLYDALATAFEKKHKRAPETDGEVEHLDALARQGMKEHGVNPPNDYLTQQSDEQEAIREQYPLKDTEWKSFEGSLSAQERNQLRKYEQEVLKNQRGATPRYLEFMDPLVKRWREKEPFDRGFTPIRPRGDDPNPKNYTPKPKSDAGGTVLDASASADDGGFELVSAKKNDKSKDPWVDPKSWRNQNPNGDWNQYFRKYGPDFSDQKDPYKGYKQEHDDYEASWKPFWFDFKTFKEVFPDKTEQDYKDFVEGYQNQPETYEDYLENLPPRAPRLSKKEWTRQNPSLDPETDEEKDAFDKLLTDDERKKLDLDRIPGDMNSGWIYDRSRTERRPMIEFLKKFPEKVFPKLDKLPAPQDGWPPGYQGSELEKGRGTVLDAAAGADDGDEQPIEARTRRGQKADPFDTSVDAIMKNETFISEVKRRMKFVDQAFEERSAVGDDNYNEHSIISEKKRLILQEVLNEQATRAFKKQFGRDLTRAEQNSLDDSVHRKLRNMGVPNASEFEDLFKNLLKDNDRREDTQEGDAPRKTSDQPRIGPNPVDDFIKNHFRVPKGLEGVRNYRTDPANFEGPNSSLSAAANWAMAMMGGRAGLRRGPGRANFPTHNTIAAEKQSTSEWAQSVKAKDDAVAREKAQAAIEAYNQTRTAKGKSAVSLEDVTTEVDKIAGARPIPIEPKGTVLAANGSGKLSDLTPLEVASLERALDAKGGGSMKTLSQLPLEELSRLTKAWEASGGRQEIAAPETFKFVKPGVRAELLANSFFERAGQDKAEAIKQLMRYRTYLRDGNAGRGGTYDEAAAAIKVLQGRK